MPHLSVLHHARRANTRFWFMYTWLQKRMSAPAWGEKKDDTKRSLIQEERERIAGTRFGRVTRMRRKEPVASGE
jgi:hypothetical protein